MVAVLTVTISGSILTTNHGIARFSSADIIVVTINGCPRDASPRIAHIASGTSIPVTARSAVQSMCAANTGLAKVIGTDIAVIAIDLAPTAAISEIALLAHGAEVIVITGHRVELVDASQVDIAAIVRADIIIVTVNLDSALANPSTTLVIGGAGIAVITLCAVWQIDTPALSITRVIGARITIVARLLAAADANAETADITSGTNIAVIARGLVEEMEATECRVTGVAGANLLVIALQQGCVDTLTGVTVVTQGTGVTIVTFSFVGHMLARTVLTADIISTWVPIIAIRGGPGHTLPGPALVIQGARVAVVTGQ